MKFLIVFALALATASAFNLPAVEIESRSVVAPVLETEGNTASVNDFRYQVGLSIEDSTYSSVWCGGSLIGKNWVLTAAHCTDGVQSVTVYLGATVNTSAEVTYTVSTNDIIIHSGWNSTTWRNDISLIKIPSVSYSSKIQPIAIPTIANSSSTYAGDYVIASGWFSDPVTGVTNSSQWARLPVITNSACAATNGTSIVTGSNICVSTPKGAFTCSGGNGYPLVLESNKIQIGLNSFDAAAGCAKGNPVAFTRLTSYLDWIKSNTGISY